jgi:UDP-N-acetylglucosamine--N-acetylmuramyl-(pentapeptide) pyrophosphoryl-undecaprenol N-acetylglucosamine transferase
VEADLAARAGLPYRTIRTGQLRGRAPWTAARNLGHMRTGARQARAIMDTFRPDVCFVTGGYVCAPVVWAASRARVPVLIYLPDLEPGMAIRVLSRLAARVAVSFPEVLPWFPGKGVVTGYPVRAEFMAAAADRAAARAHFGLEPGCRTLLVFGGSRGSHSINQAVMAALPRLLDACQVIHVSGALDWEAVQAQAADLPEAVRARYHAFAYLHDDMAQAMAAADLVVARAGASTLGEFPAMALPSILVPYPYAGQHQDVNADYLVAHGAAIKVRDEALADQLASTVLDILKDDHRLASLATGAHQLARPNAAQAIADELSKLARKATQL